MSLLNKEYLEELARTTVLDIDFSLCEDMGDAVSTAEWEVDKVLAREFAELANDDTDYIPARYHTMAENVREEYNIDVEDYIKDMVDADEYVHDRELARMGL